MEKAKKVEFEPAGSLHKNWLNYTTKHTVNEEIETLYQLNTITGCTDEILDCLFHLAIQSSMSQKETAKMLSGLIYQLFWHFVGPDTIALRKNDIKHLEKGIGCVP